MDEAWYVFNRTNAERAVVSKSAAHKGNGSAVAKLGSKPVTTTEILDKHGPIMTYPETDSFMTYPDFVRLPNDLKVEFVNKMMDRYDISLKYLSRFLFNKGDDGLRAMCEKWKILKQIDTKKKRGDTKESIERFRVELFDWQERTKKAKEMDRIQARMKQKACPNLIGYDEFKKLSPEDQADFVNRAIKYYQVSAAIIAEELFKIRATSLCNHFQRLGITKKIENLPIKISRNKEIMHENRKKFAAMVSAWEDFYDEIKVIDIQPVFRQLTKEEGHEVINESLRKITEMSESEIHEKAQDILSMPSNPVQGAIPPDSEFELDNDTVTKILDGTRTFVDRIKERRVSKWYQPVEEPEPIKEAEPDPMEYHQMHFSTSYISANGVNMDEINAIAAFFKNCKRVKVNIEISEV